MIYYDWHKNRINCLNKRLAAYTIAVQDILEDLNKQACHIAGRTGYSADSELPFSFNDYPQTKAAIERLKQQYVSDLKTFITTNTTKEWRNSNVVQDLLVHKVFTESKMQIDGVKRKHLYQTNPEALKAFQNRRINQQGTLSTTLWKQSDDYLDELERTIGTAIKKGTSAVTLSKQVSKYLQDFDKLKADYKEQYGKAIDVKDCEWRAARLARSEINMAYRTAEQTRWQQMDFVLGYEIQLSKTHTDVDICDDLCGRYPKDFVWTGWHPNDKCYAVPILMSEDDFVRWNNGEPVSAKPIEDVPPQFKRWVADNADKIQSSKSLPYFVRDNRAVVNDIVGKPLVTKQDAVIGSNPSAKEKSSPFSEDSYTKERKDSAVWDKGNGEVADKALFEQASTTWLGATQQEKNAVYSYSDGDFADVNMPLRGRRYFDYQTRKQFDEKVNNITSYINKSDLPCDMWFCRGDCSISVIESRIKFAGGTMPSDLKELVGMKMQEGGFLSSSCHNGGGNQDGDVVVNIYAPKGTKAAYIEPFASFGTGSGMKWDGKQHQQIFSNEQEALFQRGTIMRITKVYKNNDKIWIDCEVIGQELKDLNYVSDKLISF